MWAGFICNWKYWLFEDAYIYEKIANIIIAKTNFDSFKQQAKHSPAQESINEINRVNENL